MARRAASWSSLSWSWQRGFSAPAGHNFDWSSWPTTSTPTALSPNPAGAVTMKTRRLFTPADGRRRLVLGAFRRVLGSRSTGRPPKTLGVTGTPVVGGVSATDERLRQVPGAEAAADARPGGREPAPARRGRLRRPQRPILATETATIELPAESIPAVEPIAVTVPVAAVHQL